MTEETVAVDESDGGVALPHWLIRPIRFWQRWHSEALTAAHNKAMKHRAPQCGFQGL
jgi:hypothetical protein